MENVPIKAVVHRRFRITVTEVTRTDANPPYEEIEVLRMEMAEREFDAVRKAALEAIRREIP